VTAQLHREATLLAGGCCERVIAVSRDVTLFVAGCTAGS
jgi:hypothetical protein